MTAYRMSALSTLQRQECLHEMSNRLLDVLVIGGGITGAGIAWDASLRGLRTGLVEMRDFASGTSSRSTKLIHGGLRYLKQGEIQLVREVGRERALLHGKLPHLVIPAPIVLPIYRGGTFGYLATSIGLYIYDWLAGVKWKERRKMLSAQEMIEHEPLVRKDGLIGGGHYFEYRTDDARLTIEVIKSAVSAGAIAANYAKVEEFLYEKGICAGAVVRDELSGETVSIRAKKVINAAGPWVDQLRKQDGSFSGKRLFLTKGVHLVFPHEKLPVKQAAYFDAPDGRMIFVIPRGRVTYVGTTDTEYKGAISEPRMTKADLDYLLSAVHYMFPSLELTEADLISNWAGLRPLIYEEGKGPSELSRKDEIFESESGLITIAGGKLTGFRKMAEKVVDLVAARLLQEEGRELPKSSTDQAFLSGGLNSEFTSEFQMQEEVWRQGKHLGLSDQRIEELYALYGVNALKIYHLIRSSKESAGDRDLQLLVLDAEIEYGIQEEMIARAEDFLIRRTGWLYFQPDEVKCRLPHVVDSMAAKLGWNEERKLEEMERVNRELDSIQLIPGTEDNHAG